MNGDVLFWVFVDSRGRANHLTPRGFHAKSEQVVMRGDDAWYRFGWATPGWNKVV